MRIAFFADSYKPYLSGVTNAAEVLVNELRQLGHRVYVFAPRYPGHVDTDPDIRRFPSIAGGYPGFRLALPFIREIPAVDIIHAHSPFQAGLLARFVARRRGLPFVYSFHTLFTRYVHYARFVPPALAKMGIVAYLRGFCRGADIIFAPSEMARRALRAWRIDRPVEVVPAGVEIHLTPREFPDLKAKLRKQLGIPPGDQVLLYAGRLSKEKNLPFILQAFERLSALVPRPSSLHLVLVGGGPLAKELRRQRHKNIHLTGEIAYPTVLLYYALGDIFVFSSLTETQGLVLAEAKAAGLPIVALYAGGLAGTVRSGLDGYLLPRDLGTYVDHLRRLLADEPLREKMSLAAREDARQRFAAAVVAKKVEAVYNSFQQRRTER